MLSHEEIRVGEFYLLVVEREPGAYRLYVGVDGEHYTHYDTGHFRDIRAAVKGARRGFDPTPFKIFPYAPFAKTKVLQEAPHGFDSLPEGGSQQGRG